MINGDHFDDFKTTRAMGMTTNYVVFVVIFSVAISLDYFDIYMVSFDKGINQRPVELSECITLTVGLSEQPRRMLISATVIVILTVGGP
jgi:hypothetical protein